MRQMAQNNKEVKERFDHWLYRSVEELYDYEKDPNALNNLIDDPAYSEVVYQMRQELRTWMENTNDYLLPAFDNKENPKKLNRWMENQIKQAEVRTKTYKWKRGKNQSGSTKANKALFDPNSI
jgi:N-sulfoglucosamine sulfohydrolase